MRIFSTSDIHGNYRIMEKLSNIDMGYKIDMIFICGDIGGNDHNPKDGGIMTFGLCQKQDEAHLISVLNELVTPSYYILGNDDWFETNTSYYLREPIYKYNLTFIPFEFISQTPFNTNREVNENKMRYELEKLTNNHGEFNNSIIVAHTPPYGAGDRLYNGKCCGSLNIRKWISKYQPKIWLCGHIHEDMSLDTIGNTLVVNCACNHQDNKLKGYVIDTETLKCEYIEI